MNSFVRNVFRGELFFALYLFAGVFKESIDFPIDITAMFLILTGISIGVRLIRKPNIKRYMLIPFYVSILMVGFLLVSYTIAPGELYATDKLIKFIALTIPTIVFPFFIFDNKESIVRFLFYLTALTVVLSIATIPSIIQRGSSLGFVGLNNGNYQGLARLNGVGLISLLFLFLLNKNNKMRKVQTLLSIAIVAFVLLATGSRMPLLAFVCASIYYVFQSVIVRRGIIYVRRGIKMLVCSSFLLVIAISLLAVRGYFSTALYRFTVIFMEASGGDSVRGRIDRMKVAWEMFSESPIYGFGIGSFPLFYMGIDISDYPHNMIFEVLSEFGLVGLVIFSLYFAISIYRGIILKNRDGYMSNLRLTVVCLFIYYLANSMVSGDINSNRALYVFMSIMCILPFVGSKEETKSLTDNGAKENG